ncbi:helix-turn-helix domain-containing protein [Bacillus thuringiensis]|uniref:helix-turn-helix domain-containing protein n=1 Tax=Bacillus thuringiensis TaxID=1428 RepID=UPI0005CF3B9D|nr:helix-turn-helix domain-containing protein [Bacillus thuringiensis]
MTKWVNVQEAMEILEEHYIKVSYKTFTDWLRKLEIPGVPSDNRKEGWMIRQEDVFEFVDKKRPGLRQILQEYQGLIEDMSQLKQQVELVMENREETDIYVEESNENIMMEQLQGQDKVQHEEVKFLYDFLNVVLEELQELKEQNKWMSQAYEQIVGDYNFLYEELQRFHISEKNAIQMEGLEEEIVPMINEELFQGLLQVQLKQKFPYRQSGLDDGVIKQLYTLFCNTLFLQGEKERTCIIKKGNAYICPISGTQYKHINRIYNPIIRRLLEEYMKDKNKSVDTQTLQESAFQEKEEHSKTNEI